LKLLLDTHAVLWWLADDDRVGPDAARQLDDASNRVLLSAAVAWEVAINRSLGKLQAPADLTATLLGAGVQTMPITLEHASAVEALPWHHRDPFDRMLVAQAIVEGATIVSQDERIQSYDVPIVW
jgi:PIN domain nuclease of toxin-antitoxin system